MKNQGSCSKVKVEAEQGSVEVFGGRFGRKGRFTKRSFIDKNAGVYVDKSYEEEAEALAEKIKDTGVRSADAIHAVCVLIAECDYMLYTDDRLLKFKPEKMKLVSPVEFI